MNGLGEEFFALQHQVNLFDCIGCVFCTIFALLRSFAASAFAMLNVLPQSHRLQRCSEAEEDQHGAGVPNARLFLHGVGFHGAVRASLIP